MRNIFMMYIPPGNAQAVVNYEQTIVKKVAPDRVNRYVEPVLRQRLEQVFPGRPLTIWGSRDSTANRAKFEKMRPGDEILVVEGPTIKLLGKIAAKTVNPDLSNELWPPIRGNAAQDWSLIYFIANPQQIDLPFAEFCRLMGYEESYQLRGFTTVSQDKLHTFYRRYDDLYSILMLRKKGEQVYRIPEHDLFGNRLGEEPDVPAPLPAPPPDNSGSDAPVSDHLRMQWTLANLGRKAGNKVWVPSSDQGRIRTQYQFDDFETDFAAGLDTQTKYVENIDVVWKEEYRIDAAFEIENSTAIYSGLLRFADLTLVAPNTLYPLFIVAPQEKRNRLIEQLRRPTFQKLRLDRKVRYLPYEAVEKIDRFFEGQERGLTVDVIVGHSEEAHFHH
ncbi:MAG: hypothetical protein WCC36_12490 [Gammaproteobacteria bacterium]